MSGDMDDTEQGYTHISVQKLCYKWTISNFSFCMDESRENITSPVFSLEANDEVAWCLIVHPNGVDEQSKNYLSVFLGLLSCPGRSVWANFEFWIINSRGEKYKNKKSRTVSRFRQNQYRGFKKFILKDFVFSNRRLFLPEDQFTLCCKVSMAGAFFSISGQNMAPAIKDQSHMLADDLGTLWENSLFTDCSLLVGGHEFRAHKAILAARSPVFRAMFEHEMKERLTNRVEIHDLDPQVFKELMGFIYTEKAPHLHSHSMAAGVLIAADKYGLEGLMVMCEEALCRNLSVENAAHTLILADLHSTKQLKTQALDFIELHASEVFETSEWKSMVETHPHLEAETFQFLGSAHSVSGAITQTPKMSLGDGQL